MMQQLQKIRAIHVFSLFALGYLLSFALPTYFLHPLVETFYRDYAIDYFDGERISIIYGYQAASLAFLNLFKSPIAFIGSLSNISVFAMFIFQLIKLPGKLNFLKSVLVVVAMVSTLIWPVALRIGMLSGYYLWMFCCIGMAISFSVQKPYQEDFEDQVLDDLQL
jgi:hypothetical protein